MAILGATRLEAVVFELGRQFEQASFIMREVPYCASRLNSFGPVEYADDKCVEAAFLGNMR